VSVRDLIPRRPSGPRLDLPLLSPDGKRKPPAPGVTLEELTAGQPMALLFELLCPDQG
jgi:hypothetical protein